MKVFLSYTLPMNVILLTMLVVEYRRNIVCKEHSILVLKRAENGKNYFDGPKNNSGGCILSAGAIGGARGHKKNPLCTMMQN